MHAFQIVEWTFRQADDSTTTAGSSSSNSWPRGERLKSKMIQRLMRKEHLSTLFPFNGYLDFRAFVAFKR